MAHIPYNDFVFFLRFSFQNLNRKWNGFTEDGNTFLIIKLGILWAHGHPYTSGIMWCVQYEILLLPKTCFFATRKRNGKSFVLELVIQF